MSLGRRSQLETNTEKIDTLLNYLRLGLYINQACAMSGLAESTYHYWRSEGERVEKAIDDGDIEIEGISDADLLLLEFLESVKKARAEAEAFHLRNLRQASEDGTWQASAWWLERSFPERWGRKDRVEVTGQDEGPLIVEIEFRD